MASLPLRSGDSAPTPDEADAKLANAAPCTAPTSHDGTTARGAEGDGEGSTLADGRSERSDANAKGGNKVVDGGAEAAGELGDAAVKEGKEITPDDEESERFRVDFEPHDKDCPTQWSKRRKWMTAGLACWFCFLAGFTGGCFSGAIPQVTRELGVSRELGELGLSIFPIGFGVAPLFLAPFSESFGRLPVYHVTFFLYLLFFVPIGLAQNIQTIIICRFIQGCAASTGSTMAAGTIADVFLSHERGLPMAIFSLAAFAGVGSGPLCMSYVSQNIGWRWTQWIQLISAGLAFLLIVALKRETRASVLLMRKAERRRRETGEGRWWCVPEREKVSLGKLIKASSTRAIYLLVTEPIVMSFSLWISFAWAVMWGLLGSIVLILENVYGFSQGDAGLGFAAIVVGSILGFLTNPIQERLYLRKQPTVGAEARLYSAMVGGLLLPIGGFIMGWTQGNGPWIAPLIGVTILMMGVYHIYCSCFNYLADCYGTFASSAIAGQSFARNMVGAAFPLIVYQMYGNLGYQWASTLIACIGLIGAVLPFVLYAYGPQIRARSKVASAIMESEQRAKEEAAARRRKGLGQEAA